MPSLRTLVDDLTDESLRTATLVGLASIPFTIVRNWNVTSEPMSVDAVVIASLIVGYLYSTRSTESRRAGVRTGLVGSIPIVVWLGFDAFATFYAYFELVVVAVGATLFTIVVFAGLLALVGMVGAIAGDWLASKLDRVRPTIAGT